MVLSNLNSLSWYLPELSLLLTSIAVAFARNPMILANLGYDLQLLSKGRFIMGLGSQIKPHIEKRFSMPWSSPAKRMREMIMAIKAIWHSWDKGERLDFRGEFYSHTLMTPFFNPGKHDYGLPPIFLAAVGPLMTSVAAEVADGLMVHPFHTNKFIDSVTIPSIQKGLKLSNNEDFKVSIGIMVAVGETQDQIDQAVEGLRNQISFYASTPAYKVVLDEHGWGSIQGDLNNLTKKGKWDEMPKLISDEMLETIGVVGNVSSASEMIIARYKEVASRIAPTFFSRDSNLHIELMDCIKKQL